MVQYPARLCRKRLMKVSISDTIHKNTSYLLVFRSQHRDKPSKVKSNTFDFGESLEQISDGAAAKEVCPALAQARDGFAMPFPVIWEA